ncbi:hypothetical protein AAVH_18301, partial [Aphelenchoides avenae]
TAYRDCLHPTHRTSVSTAAERRSLIPSTANDCCPLQMVSIQSQASQYVVDLSTASATMDESPLAKMEKACGEIGKNDAVDKKPATATPSSVRTKGVSPNIRPGSSASEDRKHATNGTHKKDNGDSGKGGNGKINGCGFDKKALGCEPSTSTAYCGFPGAMQRNFTSMPGMMPPFGFNPAAAAGAANPYLAMFPGAAFGFMPPHSAAFGMLPPGFPQNATAAAGGMMPPMMMPLPPSVPQNVAQNGMEQLFAAQMAAAAAASHSLFMPQSAAGPYASFPFHLMNGNANAIAASTAATPTVPTSSSAAKPSSIDSLLMAVASGQVQNTCLFSENGVPCGKTYASNDELTAHYKAVHCKLPAPSTPNGNAAESLAQKSSPVTSSATTPTDNVSPTSTLSTASSARSAATPTSHVTHPAHPTNAQRFHPYGRPSAATAAAAQAANANAAQQMALMQQFAAMASMAQQQGQGMPPFPFMMPMGMNPAAMAAQQGLTNAQMQRLAASGVPHS